MNNSTKPNSSIASIWTRLKDRLIFISLWLFVTSPISVPVIVSVFYVPLYRASLKSAEFTVERRERVVKGSGDSMQSYYLVWSREGEVFCVADSWSFFSFDSSDRYGKLHEGSHAKVKVAGWRVPFLSWYRNVIAIESVAVDKDAATVSEKEPAQPAN